MTSFKIFLEGRKDGIEYSEIAEKGVVTRVVALLGDPAQKGYVTKVARQYVTIKEGMERLEAMHKERAAELRKLVGDQFDDEIDQFRTRVVDSGKMVLTLAKNTKPEDIKEKIEVDWKKLAMGLQALVADSLKPQVDELLNACTRRWSPEPGAPALRVTTKEAQEQLDEGILSFFKRLTLKLKRLTSKFDIEFAKLKAQLAALV
jgi:hypothetical protein